MKSSLMAIGACAACIASAVAAGGPGTVSPNGIEMPEGYHGWRVIGVSHRTDNNTLRAIIGNDQAIEAARAGATLPWPDGAILAKIVWRADTLAAWQSAIVPGEYVQIEFMVKDHERFPDTGGWGFARWVGAEKRPYGADASFAMECFGCHTPQKDSDYVFTAPAAIP